LIFHIQKRITFTITIQKKITFLDTTVGTTVSIKGGKISTDLYVKPTDTHQYLLSSSCHPYRTKRSIPYSLGLRPRRIFSDDTAFNKCCDELGEHLKRRGYKEKLIQREINKARQVPRDQALKITKRPEKQMQPRHPVRA